jgi:hypothetical protein
MGVAAAVLLGMVAPVVAGADVFVNDASTAGDLAVPGCATMGAGVASAPCGSCERPCATPQLAYDANPVGPGDTLYLNAGTYLGPSGACMLDLKDPAKAGASGRPLTVMGFVDGLGCARRDASGKPLVLLDGNGQSTGGACIGVSFVTLRGVGITHTAFPGPVEPFGDAVRLVSLTGIDGFVLSGLDIFGLADNSMVNAIDVDDDQPICNGCEISFNRLHDLGNTDGAIWVDGTGGVVVKNNEVVASAQAATAASAAISVSGAPSAQILNNLVRDNATVGISVSSPCRSACAVSRNSVGVVIRNNTLVHDSTAQATGCEVELSGSSVVDVRNNVLVPSSGRKAICIDSLAIGTSDYNDFELAAPGSRAGFQGTSTYPTLVDWQLHPGATDAHSLSIPALFVSASDLHLMSQAGHWAPTGFVADAASSRLLDAGDPASSSDLEPAPNGGRIELGAFGNTPQASATPVTFTRVAGDTQTGETEGALAEPFTVSVVETQTGRAARGVVVQFEPTWGKGQVNPALATTDAAGRASTTVTLGAAGSHGFLASIPTAPGAGTLTFTAIAAATPDAGAGACVRQVTVKVASGCESAPGSALPILALSALVLWGARWRRRSS